MPKPNIFISHQWRYNDEYHSLKKKFKELGWAHIDYSVPEHDPLDLHTKRKIELALQEQVRQCNFFIIFARMASYNSSWVQREVEIAVNYGKHRLAVRPWNYQGNIPRFISDNCPIVGLNAPSIVKIIESRLSL